MLSKEYRRLEAQRTYDIKALKGAAHSLKPSLRVGLKGVTEAWLKEFERNLDDHGLVKIKLTVDHRSEKAPLVEAITGKVANLTQVDAIGNAVTFFRHPRAGRNPKALAAL